MAINLEVPKKYKPLITQANQVASEMLRPISRKYDRAEHAYPKELDMLASVVDGVNAGSDALGGAGAAGVGSDEKEQTGNKNGSNMATVLSIEEMCWGDVGLLLTMPRQGLGNSAIASVASPEQLKKYGGKWAAMAITEPESGSDSASIRTTAVLDEKTGEYVLNGEKIYVTSGERADLVVVWASLDRDIGRAAIKSFIVERKNPGMKLDRLEHKLGIRASDTAAFRLEDCRVPKDALLGNPEIDTKAGFGGVMKTFDNTRPLVAAMAIGVGRACLDETRKLLKKAGVEIDYTAPAYSQHAAAARFLQMEADWEASRLMALHAAWMADNKQPNSVQASMSKAKAGRTCTEIALGCVELAGTLGYSEVELLEKWSRDVKILDIFEGTQQIQLLIIARQLLGKSSAELK
ncbi:MAG: acyl-CoA dehydrogenase family protein [Solirubrobacteraceae bacterium]|nr:acyl-CoA dehydrogenase family protein [Solirubrobacteraceae bacterium]